MVGRWHLPLAQNPRNLRNKDIQDAPSVVLGHMQMDYIASGSKLLFYFFF